MHTTKTSASALAFGDCMLRSDGLLVGPRGEWQLSERLTAVLRELVGADGNVVSRDDLLDCYWGESHGSQQCLSKTIFDLRTILGVSDEVHIESVYGQGYRLKCDTERAASPVAAVRAASICEEASHRLHDQREDSLRAARRMYRAAIHADPTCTAARIGYYETWMQLLASGQVCPSKGLPAARQALQDAISEGTLSAKDWATLGFGLAVLEWDFDGADTAIDTALGKEPDTYEVNDRAGRYFLFCGRVAEAVTHLRIASELSPFAVGTSGALACALGGTGDIEAARATVAAALRLDPGNPAAQMYYGWIEAAWGDAAAACAQSAKAHQFLPASSAVAAIHAFALAQAGERDSARELLLSLADRGRYPATSGALSSIAWRALREPEKATEALGRGLEQREFWVGQILNNRVSASLEPEIMFDVPYSRVFASRSAKPSIRRRVYERRPEYASTGI